MTNFPDPFEAHERTVHILCINRRSAPQVYVVGANANGEGGRHYRAKDGDHLYVPEPVARHLVKKAPFQFVAFEDPPQDKISVRSDTKTIDQIFAEQNDPAIKAKLAEVNATPTVFTPTTQPSLQPSRATPLVPDIDQMRTNTPILVPSEDEFLQNLNLDQGNDQDQDSSPDDEAARVARVAEQFRRMRQQRG